MSTLSIAQDVQFVEAPAAAKSDAEFAAFQQWMIGFNLYADGYMGCDCTNEQQRRGYEAAVKAEAEFQAPRPGGSRTQAPSRTQYEVGYDAFWTGTPVGKLSTEAARRGFFDAADEEAAEHRREYEDATWLRQYMGN